MMHQTSYFIWLNETIMLSSTSRQTTPNHNELDIIGFLAQHALVISDDRARELAGECYGIDTQVRRLASERDQNFHLRGEDGAEYVLKITHPAESRTITNFHTEALLHIARVRPSLPIPTVFPALDGRIEVVVDLGAGSPQVVRLLSYMQGVPLAKVQATRALRTDLGACLAGIGKALQDFHHPVAATHELLWDAKHAGQLHELLCHITEAAKREQLEQVLKNFEARLLPVLPALRWQVIHNDLNPQNVLVDPDNLDQVAGVFDFGDMVYTPLVIDVAVAAAYTLSEQGHPLAAATELVSAYHAELPLHPEEFNVLYDLIATRLAMVVLIGNWRAVLYPDNRDYLLRNNAVSWQRLQRLSTVSREEATTYFRSVCSAI